MVAACVSPFREPSVDRLGYGFRISNRISMIFRLANIGEASFINPSVIRDSPDHSVAPHQTRSQPSLHHIIY